MISKIDSYGKLGWLTLVVVAFWLAWPFGVAMLGFLLASGRLQAWRDEFTARGTWFGLDADNRWRAAWPGFKTSSSGNRSFDEYREQAIRTLEEEQREFQEFLSRLRKARDKDEFDAFMSEQRARSSGAKAEPAPGH